MIHVMVVVARTDGSFHPLDAHQFVVYDEADYFDRVEMKVRHHVLSKIDHPTHRTPGGTHDPT